MESLLEQSVIKKKPVFVSILREEMVSNYPYQAIRELLLNACMYRDMQSNTPLRFYEFASHLEILNAGGLYGNARPENFPSVNDYRNPLVASAMKTLGYVNMFNRGVGQVQTDLKENGNLPAEPGKRIGYIDPEHVEMGMRLKWFRIKSDKRATLFKRAIESAHVKDFHSAIRYYKAALNEVCQNGSPFTDAQIYSNLGMSYSSLGQYNEAFRCLKKAQTLGLNNPSIERELLWLKNNVGLF